mgnify:FL=1
MEEYPGHLCPLCGDKLKILESTIVNINFLQVKVECESTECPFYKVYKIGVENIRKYGVPQS